MTYSYMALRRLTLVLVINRAYRLVHRPISPIAGFRDFASYLRYSSKIEFALFHFSISAARRLYRQFSVVRQRLNERHGVWSKRSATIHRRFPDFFGQTLVVDPELNVNQFIAEIVVLRRKGSFGGLILTS